MDPSEAVLNSESHRNQGLYESISRERGKKCVFQTLLQSLVGCLCMLDHGFVTGNAPTERADHKTSVEVSRRTLCAVWLLRKESSSSTTSSRTSCTSPSCIDRRAMVRGTFHTMPLSESASHSIYDTSRRSKIDSLVHGRKSGIQVFRCSATLESCTKFQLGSDRSHNVNLQTPQDSELLYVLYVLYSVLVLVHDWELQIVRVRVPWHDFKARATRRQDVVILVKTWSKNKNTRNNDGLIWYDELWPALLPSYESI